MHIAPIRVRPLFAAALTAALFGLAPAAAAQPLTITVGEPIAFQVGLPQDFEVTQEEDMLFAESEDADVMVMVGASDLVAEEGNPLPVSEAESRRIFTSMILGSDSLLLALLNEGIMGAQGVQADEVVQEIRTLAGQRSAYARGPFETDGGTGWFEMHVTMKDGIIYLLAFMVQGKEGLDAHAPLFARIRESLVLADAPPS
jgi:hypothetical protein